MLDKGVAPVVYMIDLGVISECASQKMVIPLLSIGKGEAVDDDDEEPSNGVNRNCKVNRDKLYWSLN